MIDKTCCFTDKLHYVILYISVYLSMKDLRYKANFIHLLNSVRLINQQMKGNKEILQNCRSKEIMNLKRY